MKYFLMFRRNEGQTTDSFSVVDDSILKTIPKKIIKVKKEFPDNAIIKKDDLKRYVEEAGGTWYAN